MNYLLLIAAGVALWAWKTKQLRALRYGDVAAAVAALIAIRLISKGQVPIGLVGLGGAGVWLWLRARGRAMPATPPMPADEARILLDLPPGADEAAIREAHRRLIARVHPDTGGSAELARRVNLARDTLLASRGHPS